MTTPICIYHGNCADGFAAAWVVWDRFSDWEFHAGVYGDPPPDVTGRDVVIVDFSYKLPVLQEMVLQANSILVLDHHKSAADDLGEIPDAGRHWTEYVIKVGDDPDTPPLYAVFDMERSGAGIAWDFFNPGEPRPRLIDHVEDRDLWRFKLPQTREIQAALFSYPYDFRTWDRLINDEGMVTELALEGEAIERKHHKDVAELVGVCKRRGMIGGYNVPMASLPYTLTSDAGHIMAEGEPFAACYWDTPEGRVFSLRSTDKGLDVQEIAKQYGGGGHPNASGFRVPLSDIEQFEVV